MSSPCRINNGVYIDSNDCVISVQDQPIILNSDDEIEGIVTDHGVTIIPGLHTLDRCDTPIPTAILSMNITFIGIDDGVHIPRAMLGPIEMYERNVSCLRGRCMVEIASSECVVVGTDCDFLMDNSLDFSMKGPTFLGEFVVGTINRARTCNHLYSELYLSAKYAKDIRADIPFFDDFMQFSVNDDHNVIFHGALVQLGDNHRYIDVNHQERDGDIGFCNVGCRPFYTSFTGIPRRKSSIIRHKCDKNSFFIKPSLWFDESLTSTTLSVTLFFREFSGSCATHPNVGDGLTKVTIHTKFKNHDRFRVEGISVLLIVLLIAGIASISCFVYPKRYKQHPVIPRHRIIRR